MHEVKVDFRIVGFDCTAEEITEILGVSPSRVYLKGEKVSTKSFVERKENIWLLESTSNSNLDLESHLENLSQKIKPYLDSFKIVCEKYYCEFSCCLYLDKDSDDSIPSVHLDKAFTVLLKELNAETDIDIFF